MIAENKRQSNLQHHYVLGVLVEQGNEISELKDRARASEEAREAVERERAERKAREAETLSTLLEVLQMANKKDQK